MQFFTVVEKINLNFYTNAQNIQENQNGPKQ